MEGVLEWDTQRHPCRLLVPVHLHLYLYHFEGEVPADIRVHGTYGVPAAPYLDKHLVYLYALHEATL